MDRRLGDGYDKQIILLSRVKIDHSDSPKSNVFQTLDPETDEGQAP